LTFEIFYPMKKLKVVAVCLIIAQILYKYITGFQYYDSLINSIAHPTPHSLLNFSQYLLWFLLDVFGIVCGMLLLASPDHAVRDRAYKLFRFVYVIGGIFYLPELVYYMVMGWNYGNFFNGVIEVLEFILIQITWLFCTIVLILSKPVKPVHKINLNDYEMVSYTSTGHRFLHYLLDMVFLLPIVLLWSENMPGLKNSPLGMELLCMLAYFIYCFLAEAIFRQTFGKLITRSCIVSNGVKLSTGRVFLRTLSRMIPFDKFSFLFGANWHDRVSSTTVVYVDSWKNAFEEENE
jgi:hypothetical protein